MPDLLDRVARAAASRGSTAPPPEPARDALGSGGDRLQGVARGIALRGVTRRGVLAGGGVAALSLGMGVRPRRSWAQVTCGTGRHFCPDPEGGHCCNASNGCCGNQGLGHPCCAPGFACCSGILCCEPGQNCCVGFMPALGVYGGSCCPPGVGCGTTSSGSPCCLDAPGCCTPSRRCGDACCPDATYCCSPDKDLCCREDEACCPVGPAGGTEEGRTCCPPGHECTKQIVGDDPTFRPDAAVVCCPPERTFRGFGSPVCCPPGKVHMPGHRLLTRGSGTCCHEENLCGDDCCEFVPSMPMICIEGRCHWDRARLFGEEAAARRNGDVPIAIAFKGAAKGRLSLELGDAPPSGPRGEVIGSTRFKVARRGRRHVDVRLNRRGRKLLKRRPKLQVTAVITFKADGKTASSYTPVTVRAPRRRRG